MIAQFDRKPIRRPLLATVLTVLAGGVALTGAVRGQSKPAEDHGAPAAAATAPEAVQETPGTPAPASEAATQTQPASAPAARTNYQLVPGDLLSVVVSDLTGPGLDTIKQTRVGPEGTITLPELKEPLRVAGLTEADLQLEIVKAYVDAKRLQTPRVLVSVMEARSAGPGAAGENQRPSAGVGMPGMSGGMSPGTAAAPGAAGNRRRGAARGRGALGGMAGGMGGGMGMPGMGRGGMGGGAPAGMGSMMGGGGGGMPTLASQLGRVEEPADREADARAAEKLMKPTPIEFNDVAIRDALNQLAEVAGIDVVVDWKALSQLGVTPDDTVTLTLREPVPASQGLEWTLRSTAGGNEVRYAIDRGVVLVSARKELDRMIVTRAYDVSDLSTAPGDSGAIQPGHDLDGVVRITVAPEAWQEVGGAGSIIRFRDKLLVTTTEPIHREVDKLLALLRRDTRRAGAAANEGDELVGQRLPGAGPAEALGGDATRAVPAGPSIDSRGGGSPAP